MNRYLAASSQEHLDLSCKRRTEEGGPRMTGKRWDRAPLFPGCFGPFPPPSFLSKLAGLATRMYIVPRLSITPENHAERERETETETETNKEMLRDQPGGARFG
jgi:hypothetical protein